MFVEFALIQPADYRIANQVDEIRSVAGFDVGRRELQRLAFALSACSRVMA